MNLIDQLNQQPLVAIFVIMVPAIGAVWKVFHALYVKPRDFKISCLTQDLTTLKDELIRLRREQEWEASRQVVQPEAPPKPADNIERQTDPHPQVMLPAASCSPLSSLGACYKQWNDDSLTKLQKQKFETDYTGKQVSWRVQVDSVSEAAHDRIILYVKEPTQGWEQPRASAKFPISDQGLLLSLKSDDWIILQGTIAEFFLWPNINDCRIEKTN